MDKYRVDYRFTCKLLNICANKALMEDALETRETILCAAELVRYIFDDSKTVVPLRKEIDVADIYLNAFLADENGGSFQLKSCMDDEAYIDHLALLSFIVHDVEISVLLPGPKRVVYEIQSGEEILVDKSINGEKALRHCITLR